MSRRPSGAVRCRCLPGVATGFLTTQQPAACTTPIQEGASLVNTLHKLKCSPGCLCARACAVSALASAAASRARRCADLPRWLECACTASHLQPRPVGGHEKRRWLVLHLRMLHCMFCVRWTVVAHRARQACSHYACDVIATRLQHWQRSHSRAPHDTFHPLALLLCGHNDRPGRGALRLFNSSPLRGLSCVRRDAYAHATNSDTHLYPLRMWSRSCEPGRSACARRLTP